MIQQVGTYPDKTLIQKDPCTPMFIEALFTIAETWRQPKCSSTNEWIKEIWYIYEWSATFQKNEIMAFAATWIDLEMIILSEISQKKTNTNIIYM